MIGLLCPGQGSQFAGMGADLAREYPAARQTFEEADDALGFGLSGLCWQGPEGDLTLTQNAQPAILTHTVAAWRVLRERAPLPVEISAGHSLGEFSAYVAAGAIDFADAVRLVRRRGELMFESGQRRPGAMAALLGLDDEAAEALCRRATEALGGVVVPANFNSPGQIVLSGDAEALRGLEGLARDAGAKRVIPLNVSGAFHSPLMEPAAEGLARALAELRLLEPAFPVVSNVTTEPVRSVEAARELLVRQLTSPVRWVESVRTMLEFGVTRFIEVGPGNVLSGLLRRIEKSARAETVGTSAEVHAILSEEG
jgi:[acyl-carrier-protein] S-malonyltransferase